MFTLVLCSLIFYAPPLVSRIYNLFDQKKSNPLWNSYLWLTVYAAVIALGPLLSIWKSGQEKGIWVLAPAILGLALFFAMDQLLHLQKKNAQVAGQSVYVGLLAVLALHMIADGVWIFFSTSPKFGGGLQSAALVAFCWHRYWVATGLWKFQVKHFPSSISILYWLLPLFSWVGYFAPNFFPHAVERSSVMETMNIVVASIILYMLLEQAGYHLRRIQKKPGHNHGSGGF
jgi:hypothetical protein